MKKTLVLLLVIVMTIATLLGCSANEPSDPGTVDEETTQANNEGDGETLSFAYANATMNNSFFVAIDGKLKEAIEADGNTYTMYDCDWDNEKQLQQLEDIVNSKPDMIFLTPADPEGVHAGLQAAYDAGIPVIILDNPVNEEDKSMVVTTVASDNYQAGVVCAEMLMEDFPDGAKLPILTHMTNNASVNRLNGFMDTIDKDKYEIVAEFDTGGTTDGAISPSEDIIQAHPEITAWFCANEPSGIGAISALKAAGKDQEIKVYAIDASPDGKALVAEGSFAGLAAQSPLTIAEKSYELAMQYLNGEEVPEEYLTECFAVRKDFAEETAGEWQ